jgi:hypothetical protein
MPSVLSVLPLLPSPYIPQKIRFGCTGKENIRFLFGAPRSQILLGESRETCEKQAAGSGGDYREHIGAWSYGR